MLLAIETTDRGGSVALAQNNRLLELNFEESQRHQSERIMPLIDTVLEKHQVDYEQIEHLAVATGPGSFTGIRLGVTTAKTLALTCDSDLVAVSNLRLQAEYICGWEGTVVSVVDARRGELYWQKFSFNSEKIKARNKPQLITPGDLKDEMNDDDEAIMVYRDRSWEPVVSEWPENVIFYSAILVRPLAAALVNIARKRVKKGRAESPGNVKPLYIRSSDARREKNSQ